MTKIKFSCTSAAPEVFVIVSASLSKVYVVRRDIPKGSPRTPMSACHCLNPEPSDFTVVSAVLLQWSSPFSGHEGCVSLSNKGEKKFPESCKIWLEATRMEMGRKSFLTPP